MTKTDQPELADLKRGDVVLVSAGKLRPMIVVSADIVNSSLDAVIVIPVTSKKEGQKQWAHEVILKAGDGGLSVDSLAQPQYVMWIDRYARIEKRLGRIGDVPMAQITTRLMLILGHIPSSGAAR